MGSETVVFRDVVSKARTDQVNRQIQVLLPGKTYSLVTIVGMHGEEAD